MHMEKTKTGETTKHAFEVNGSFTHNGQQHAFKKTVFATSEKLAREKTLSEIGSHHRVPRHKIQIASAAAPKEK